MQRFLRISLLFAFVVSVSAGADFSKQPLEVDSPAPTWEKLKGTDGSEYSLADFQGKKAVVLVFTCNRCPVARAYEKRLSDLAATFREREVAVVAVNCSPAEDMASMIQRVEEEELEYHYVKDETQEVVHRYRVRNTPEVFLLDHERKVAYWGAIDDDSKLSGKPTQNYLRDAIEALLADKRPEPAQTRPFGCAVKRK